MGYTTEFEGSFKLNKVLDAETLDFLTKLSHTRRMKRDAVKLKTAYHKDFGIDGELFVDDDVNDDYVLDYNLPPSTQPGLWCQWRPNHKGTIIVWDGGEKFYNYVEWLQYIIEKILTPRGYKLTGTVKFQGEDAEDFGKITVRASKVVVALGKRVYNKAK